MRWMLALSLALGGLVAAGCSTDQDRHDRGVPMSGAGDAQDEKYPQTDPVCGVRVNPREATSEVYEGRTYWFDSEECQRKFHENPSAYVPRERDREAEVK